jgi:sugar fermentation stimulation protein A
VAARRSSPSPAAIAAPLAPPPPSPSLSWLPFERPLVRGTLTRRYKRFLADVDLAGHGPVTVHCPNSGSMMGLQDPRFPVLVSAAPGAARKLPWTLEFVSPDEGRTWVGCNTMRPNAVVGRLLEAGVVPGVPVGAVLREVRLGEASRIDFQVVPPAGPIHWVEVKNATLAQARPDGGLIAAFPDAVTDRGARHMAELARRARNGEAATALFFVNRADCDAFTLAADIDPAYAKAARAAARAGVRLVALGMEGGPDGWRPRGELPVVL